MTDFASVFVYVCSDACETENEFGVSEYCFSIAEDGD